MARPTLHAGRDAALLAALDAGETYDAIAASHGITRGAVASACRRLRKKLGRPTNDAPRAWTPTRILTHRVRRLLDAGFSADQIAALARSLPKPAGNDRRDVPQDHEQGGCREHG